MPRQSSTSRLQFVRVCECGCGQPTLLAPYTCHPWGWQKGVPLRFLHNHHSKGERNNHWKGRRYADRAGYIWIYRPDHPYAKRGGMVQEHRAVVEDRLGRYLEPHEVVHHRDENPSNNAPENLELVSRAEHVRIHNPKLGWRKMG